MKKPDKHIYLLSLLLFSLMLLSGCSSQPEADVDLTPTVGATDTPIPGAADAGQAILDATGLDVVPTLAEIATTRTPEPTTTPDALTREITNIVQETGLAGKTFFWLDISDWISLGISLLFVIAGYLVGTWMIHWLLPRLVKRTKTTIDDRLLEISGNQLRWLVVVLILRFAVKRLNFVNPGIKTFIDDICFFLILFLISSLLWRLINLAAEQADARAKKIGHQKEAESLITLMVWGLRILVVILILTLILVHYGVNITGFAFILGVIVLAFSLAGRDILTDIISGAMILIDRPYRIGDRLELQSIDTWGDVVDIGMRSTKILTVENRMVVIPNSQIGKNAVVNYSYPDPSYFNTINVVVSYENDPELVEKIIVEAIKKIEGVQVERGVSAILIDLNKTHMRYWANWWVANYTDRYPLQGTVSQAIIKALKEAGVVLPNQMGNLNVEIDSKPEEMNSKGS